MFYTVGDVEHPFWVNSMVLYGRYTVEPGKASSSSGSGGATARNKGAGPPETGAKKKENGTERPEEVVVVGVSEEV